MSNFDTKNIYLKKDDKIIGLHSVGYNGPYTYTLEELDGTKTEKSVDFMPLESWGNEYDDNYNMIGLGSFRIGDFIEDEAKKFESDGWIRFERNSF